MKTLDSSMLKDFLECPRYFGFRHIVGLKPDTDDTRHADWGTLYHSALERMYNGQNVLGVVSWAEQEAEKYVVGNKTPDNMRAALHEYVTEFINEIRDHNFELEVGGYVKISDDVRLMFRCDMIKPGLVVDHKTSGTNNVDSYATFLSNSMQTYTYLHVLACMHGYSPLNKIEYRVARVLKTKTEIIRLVFSKTPNEMELWRRAVLNAVDNIQRCGHDLLQNSDRCSKYGRECPYIHICSRDLKQFANNPPPGFTIKFWNPFDHMKPAKEIQL